MKALHLEKVEKQRVAVIVAGTWARYMFNSSLHHLIRPMLAQGHDVDYYLYLTTAKAKAYRSESEYMNHVRSDPVLGEHITTNGTEFINSTEFSNGTAFSKGTEYLRSEMKAVGVSFAEIVIKERVDIDSNMLLKESRSAANASDPDTKFPMFDSRTDQTERRTANGNRNLLRLHLAIQHLWQRLVEHESKVGWKYDYVLFLRDDMFWLDDFDLNNLIMKDGSVFLPSCDAREPRMDEMEVNDHALVARRASAELFGNYYTELFRSDILQNCTARLSKVIRNGGKRGCNSEMILKYMMDIHHIAVEQVGQGDFPFQRSVNVEMNDGSIQQCFHKFCQSMENSLVILPPYDKIQVCKELSFKKTWADLF